MTVGVRNVTTGNTVITSYTVHFRPSQVNTKNHQIMPNWEKKVCFV